MKYLIPAVVTLAANFLFAPPAAFAGTPGYLVCGQVKGKLLCTGKIADALHRYARDQSCRTREWNRVNQAMIDSECESTNDLLNLDQTEERYFFSICENSCASLHFDLPPPLPSEPPPSYPPFVPGKAAGVVIYCSNDAQCGIGEHCDGTVCSL